LDRELTRWLSFTFEIQEDIQLCPEIKLECLKDDKIFETKVLEKKHTFILGQEKHIDYTMLHKSISRRHVCFLNEKKVGVCIIDLGSKAGKDFWKLKLILGTILNNERLNPHHPYKVKDGDLFTVGHSTRSYRITLDFSSLRDYLGNNF
jgi:pSer/pThr/pTyr-binding forkhead associated (FHA) protein